MTGDMNQEKEKLLDEILTVLCEAPDGQIAESEIASIQALIGKEPGVVVKGLESVLDTCCYAGLASDFAMKAIEYAMWLAERLVKEKQDKANEQDPSS